ncbi:MAG: glycosyltransferase family 2 protein [Candidatus Acidiferrales bacterium]
MIGAEVNQIDLSIIIINWKCVAYTRQCLASIYANAGGLSCEVIVVDNASYDGCDAMVKSDFPQVAFLQSDRNLGFAGANNLAFAQSQGRNVLFLNPDTEVQGEALQILLSTLESLPHAGMAGARLLNSDFTLQTTCVVALPSILNQAMSSNYLRRTFPKWRTWGMRPLFVDGNSPRPVEAISGACMMGKREVLEQVGAFRTDYFMYAEDMDLCAKIAEAKWKIYYVPDARIVHHAAGSSSSRRESNFSSIMLRESLIRFMEFHRGRRYAFVYRCSTAFMAAFRLLLLLWAFPMAIHPKGYSSWSRSFSKWFDLLRWAMGATRWVSQQHTVRSTSFRKDCPASDTVCRPEKA